MCAAPMRGCEPGKTRLGRLPKRRYGKIPLAPIASPVLSRPCFDSNRRRPFLASSFRYIFGSKNGGALSAAMGVAAKRACRLQERRLCLLKTVAKNLLQQEISFPPEATPDGAAS